jgi:hypothetical protein
MPRTVASPYVDRLPPGRAVPSYDRFGSAAVRCFYPKRQGNITGQIREGIVRELQITRAPVEVQRLVDHSSYGTNSAYHGSVEMVARRVDNLFAHRTRGVERPITYWAACRTRACLPQRCGARYKNQQGNVSGFPMGSAV